MRPLSLILLLVLLAGCAAAPGPDGGAGAGTGVGPSSAGGPGDTDGGMGGITDGDAAGDLAGDLVGDLVVVIDRGNGAPSERYTLTCAGDSAGDSASDSGGAPGGDHPDASAACAHLQSLAEPFAPIPADAVCTEQYGGPQIAHVTGTWRGQPVDLRLSRVDGCRIAQWDQLGPLLPGPVGVEPVE